MSDELGGREYGHGDELTATFVNDDSGADQVEEGDLVALVGDHEVDLADANGAGELVGVAAHTREPGETLKVIYRGVAHVKVASGVGAGDVLGAPDTSTTGSTAGVGESGGSTGVIAMTGAVDPDGDGTFEAEVLLR